MMLWQELVSVEEKVLYQVDQKTQDLQSKLDSCEFRVSIRPTATICYDLNI